MPITSDNVTCQSLCALTTAIAVAWNPQGGGLPEPNLCPHPTPEIVDSPIPSPPSPVIRNNRSRQRADISANPQHKGDFAAALGGP
jgi:hypothetical protein